MPQIREYNQQVEPNASMPDKRVYPNAFEMFPSNAGKGITDLAEVVQQQQERDDTANVHVMMAQARSDWTTHLAQVANKTATDVSMSSGQVNVGDQPGQPGKPVPIVNVGNFADDYTSELSTYLTNAKQNVTTKAGARLFDAMAANLHGELTEKAMGAQAHLTGMKAVADYHGALNNYRNVLLGDPSQFQSVLKEASEGLGSWVDIPADQRIKLMEQTSEKLALSAIQGQVRQDPQVALKQLNDGEWDNYLSANGKFMAEHQADQGIRAQQTEAARIARGQEALEQKVRTAVNDGFMSKFVDGNLSMKEVLDSSLKPFGEGSKETWRALIEKQNADGLKPVKTDPALFQNLFQDIHRPAGDPDKLTNEDSLNQAFINGQLNRTDLSFLRKEVQDDRTPDGQRLNEQKAEYVKSVKNVFDSTIIGKNLDTIGPQKLYDFTQFMETKIDEAKALHEDPHDLFNPKSKKYIGQYVPQFLPSMTERMRAMEQSIQQGDSPAAPVPVTPQPVPSPVDRPREPGSSLPKGNSNRLPGETTDQYLKRTGP